MPYLAIDPDTLRPNGSIHSKPTMLLAAVISPLGTDAKVTILKCYYGKQMIDLIDRRKHQGLSAIAGLLFVSPPHLNRTKRWRVDVIEDLGRTQICDSQGARFTIYGYRTSSGVIYIDNALPDPSHIKRWRSILRMSNPREMSDVETRDFRCKLVSRIEDLANKVLPFDDLWTGYRNFTDPGAYR